MEREAAAYPGTKVLDQAGYAANQSRFVDQMLGLVYALLMLAIIIALLGIGNTLALSVLERTRELGVMRAVGMTRNQLKSAIRWEAVLIALLGTVVGLAVGMIISYCLVKSLGDFGLSTFRVPVVTLLVQVLIAAGLAVLASWFSARRAAKLNVLDAIATE